MTDAPAGANVSVRRDGPIAVVEFARPAVANALNFDHLHDIEQTALAFRDDDQTLAVIFTGQGKHFSSGADLADGGAAHQGSLALRRRRSRIGERAIHALLDMDQITIAAWNGAAMGGGACLATAMDFRIGADDCFMQYPEVDIGLNLMWKSLPLIVELIGPARAKRLVVGGERVHAQTLLDWGVLDELVPRDELLVTAQAWAKRYAAKPPIAAQMIKRSINALSAPLGDAIMHMDTDQNLFAARTEDQKIAVAAYLNGEPPEFSGN
ncbi:MAG: enoyl-CoA hydratase/isomerase family protein [Pseudomonadota bacterium]